VGAVVQVYSGDAVEVEFVTASGRTQAVVTLKCISFAGGRETSWPCASLTQPNNAFERPGLDPCGRATGAPNILRRPRA